MCARYFYYYRKSSEDLEKSLHLSLHKVDNNVVSNKETEKMEHHKQAKSKKEKKHKKHKKEKKEKKQKKAKEKDKNHVKTVEDDKKKHVSPDTVSNKNLNNNVKDDSEDLIKIKFTSSYYETVTKIKQIEKLSLKVEEPLVKTEIAKCEINAETSLHVEESENDNKTVATETLKTSTPLEEKSLNQSSSNECKVETLYSADVKQSKTVSDIIPDKISEQTNNSMPDSIKSDEKIGAAAAVTLNDTTMQEK